MVIVLVRACAPVCVCARAWFVLCGCNHQVLFVVEQVGRYKPRVVARELQRLPAGRSVRPTRATGAALRAQSSAHAPPARARRCNGPARAGAPRGKAGMRKQPPPEHTLAGTACARMCTRVAGQVGLEGRVLC